MYGVEVRPGFDETDHETALAYGENLTRYVNYAIASTLPAFWASIPSSAPTSTDRRSSP